MWSEFILEHTLPQGCDRSGRSEKTFFQSIYFTWLNDIDRQAPQRYLFIRFQGVIELSINATDPHPHYINSLAALILTIDTLKVSMR
jgi:hypothetical protein